MDEEIKQNYQNTGKMQALDVRKKIYIQADTNVDIQTYADQQVFNRTIKYEIKIHKDLIGKYLIYQYIFMQLLTFYS